MKKLVKKYGLRRLVRLNGLSQSGGGRRKGFTLIEILIVMIILGVLAAVVTLSLTGAMGRGEATACQQEYLGIRTAVIMYYAEHDMTWPDESGDESGDLFDAWTGDPLAPPADQMLVTGGYLDDVPTSDEECNWEVTLADDSVKETATDFYPEGTVYTSETGCPCYDNVDHEYVP